MFIIIAFFETGEIDLRFFLIGFDVFETNVESKFVSEIAADSDMVFDVTAKIDINCRFFIDVFFFIDSDALFFIDEICDDSI